MRRWGGEKEKMPSFPTQTIGTPGKGDRDAEGAPHNPGESPAP